MKVGLIGAGNMARAMARGWGDPVLVSDTGSGRAQALVDDLGGEAFSSNVEVAKRADVLVLCHKPYHLKPVAEGLEDFALPVVSVLAGVSLARLQRCYPLSPAFAFMPNTPVEIRQGILIYAEPSASSEIVDRSHLEPQILDLFGRLGSVVRVAESLMSAATSVTGVGPAYQALLIEAQIDAAVRHGISPELAAQMVVGTVRGTCELIAERGYDTLAVRREVTSPGGSTARGLDALERSGIRSAFQAAADAVINPPKPND